MVGTLQVWLVLVCNGDVNLGEQILQYKEGMAVSILSVSVWTGKEEDQEGDYKWGTQWSCCEKMGSQRKQDGGSTVSPASPSPVPPEL